MQTVMHCGLPISLHPCRSCFRRWRLEPIETGSFWTVCRCRGWKPSGTDGGITGSQGRRTFPGAANHCSAGMGNSLPGRKSWNGLWMQSFTGEKKIPLERLRQEHSMEHSWKAVSPGWNSLQPVPMHIFFNTD